MTPRFSIVVPSLGKTAFLTPLIKSLSAQDFSDTVELILCITDFRDEHKITLPALPSHMELIFKDSPRPGISVARNVGIEAARGEIILFLDEDCFLPSPQYLKNLSAYCTAHPQSSGGGLYLTVDDTSDFGSAFYNYVCNSWLLSHVSAAQQATVLLGGCCFYPRHVLLQKKVSFPEHKPRAGEEMDFNNDLRKQGCAVLFDECWSVYHNPGYSLEDVFKRAWLHGLSLENGNLIPQVGRLSSFASDSQKKPYEFFKFLPMTVAYSLWGRAAYVSKFFQK